MLQAIFTVCVLDGCGLPAVAYEIKTFEIYSVCFLARYMKFYTNENFPLYGNLWEKIGLMKMSKSVTYEELMIDKISVVKELMTLLSIELVK